MSYVREEIASQPALWRRAAEAAGSEAGRLPAAGQYAAIVGCGTSLFMAEAWAAAREHAGLGATDAFTPSEALRRRRSAHTLGYDHGGARLREGTCRRHAHCRRDRHDGEPDRRALRRHRAA